MKFSTAGFEQGDKLPYLVLRGRSQAPYYKRRVPPDLRGVIGQSTITTRLQGDQAGTPKQRAALLSSWALANDQAEQQLTAARLSQRQLTPQEQLGAAGAWAPTAPIDAHHPDTNDRQELIGVLQTLVGLDVVLPNAVPAGWRPPEPSAPGRLIEAAEQLAGLLAGLDHPGNYGWPDGELTDGRGFSSDDQAADFIGAVVQANGTGLAYWLQQARTTLSRLGVVVDATQQQQTALRLLQTSRRLGDQTAAIQQGEIPTPLSFPPPPEPTARTETLATAFERWRILRSPSHRSVVDTERRLAEFKAAIGTDRLDALTVDRVLVWRDGLLEGRAIATAKKHLALIRAVLQTAADDGLPVPQVVLDRLSGRGIKGSSGTKRQRRHFSGDEAATLIRVSREQSGRALDRWAFPLGLALGCRLEELAGLQKDDISQVDGIPVVRIWPTEERRLKSDSSCREIPIPEALRAEGFLAWVEAQPAGFLFDEPEPPASDPRRSHYASIRLGKILRNQAGISDKAKVFHSARHTVAQQLVDAGSEQRLIEQILGHRSKSMTSRYSRAGLPLTLLASAMEERDWGWWPEPTKQSG